MKRIISLLLTIILCLSMSSIVFADNSDSHNMLADTTALSGDSPRAEETEWVIRWYNGLIQKRLWSITYGYWLTDWETIGYYDP